MIDNLGKLSNILITKNNAFEQITNYLLNDTFFSFFNIIERIKEILNIFSLKNLKK